MSAIPTIKFDVMLRGRFVATFKMPLYYADGIENGKYLISDETLCKYAESKRTSLKGQPYLIRF